MTPELALALGRAVTFVAGRGQRHAPRVLIGKDTRLSGYMLETALAAGISSMGGRVLLCGPVPTPAVAHLTVSMRADAGIVISASHNPYDDNGIKIFGRDGFKLPDAAEAEIETLIREPERLGERQTGPAIGRAAEARGLARALRRLRQEHLPARPHARRRARRGRRGARRRLRGGAARVLRARRARLPARRAAERHQHQPRGGRAPPRARLRRGGAARGRASASRSTATPTA